MRNLKELADSIVEFLNKKHQQLNSTERQNLLKSLITVEQFITQEETNPTGTFRKIDD